MEALFDLITQNGIGVACVAFMIYFINTTLKDNTNVLSEINKNLAEIQATLMLMNKNKKE